MFVNVNLTLTHTWVEDLRIYLVSPDGTKVTLSQNSGGDGDNYTETIFGESSQSIIARKVIFQMPLVLKHKKSLVDYMSLKTYPLVLMMQLH